MCYLKFVSSKTRRLRNIKFDNNIAVATSQNIKRVLVRNTNYLIYKEINFKACLNNYQQLKQL